MKQIFILILLLGIGQLVSAQATQTRTFKFSDLVAWEAANPELLKACKTCPNKEADEGFKTLHNPNMPFPPGAVIKRQAENLDRPPVNTNPNLPPNPLPNAPSRPPVQNWLGHVDAATTIPPDTHGAVGINHVITATNNFIKIHNKVGGAQVSQVSISTFTGIGSSCDPYMIFDPVANRWVFSAIQCTTNGNRVILITSNTADPTGTWTQISWVPTGPSHLLDHPYVGFDANWIVVSGRRFPAGFAGPSLYIIDKAAMYAGTPIVFGTNAQQIDKTTVDGDSPLPVTVYDPPFSNTGNPSPGTFYILQAWNGTSIRLSTVTGTLPTCSWNTTTAVFPSGGTPWINSFATGGTAKQVVETRLLSANDARISGGVMMNGKIWCSQHIGFGAPIDRIAVQWWQLDGAPGASFGNVLQRGRIGDVADEYKWFSGIAVNKDEDVLIGYSASTTTTRVGAAYSTRQASTPINTTDDNLVYHAGEDRYWKDFGSGRPRWGDYAHNSLDPVDNSLWTIQQYSAPGAGAIPPDNNSRWGVWWAQVPRSQNPAAPIIVAAGSAITAENCVANNNQLDPNETVTVNFSLQNTGTTNTASLVGTLQATGGVTAPSAPQNYGVVVAGGPIITRSFSFTVGNIACGTPVTATIQLQDGAANLGTITYNFTTGPTCCTPCVPASVTGHPASVQVCPTGNASFSVTAGGSGPFTYQWQESTTGAGGPWNNITNGGIYGGAQSATLTLTGVTAGMNNNQYRAVVTGACGAGANSNPAVLSVVATSTGGIVTPPNSVVCTTPNTGTLTLSGHVGAVIRWESATNLAGPWTPIANTTTTLTYNNLAVTTYFRAVVQAAGCVASPSVHATVTVSATAPIVIVAVPGTTLCAGDPAALTVYESAGTSPVTVTHSSSNTIAALNGVSCGTAGLNTAINSFWRVYNLNAFPAVTGAFTINSVNFGIEQLSGGTQLFTVRLYNQTGAAFPGGTRTQIASQTFNIPVQNLTVFTATFGTPVTVANTQTIVVEVEKSAVVNGQFFWPGGNALAETGPSYLSAAACGINTPVTFASIGFPNTHLVMGLAGTIAGVGAIVTGGTFLWSPAAGLSSTTTNPVAASPAVTTTYTVTHNNGAGCIRTANITLNINQRPTVTVQPVNVTSCATTIATFSVTGTGTNVTYQWQESTNGGLSYTNLANFAPYSGVTTPTLTINPVTVAMNGNRYRAVLSGTCPPAGTANISVGAILNINALPVVTVTPTSGCGGIAGVNGLLLSTGSQAPPIPGSVTVNSGTLALAIPDGPATWPQTLFPGVATNMSVAGIPANATVTGMSVKLNLTHTYIADMVIVLKAPNGAVFNLDANINRTGGAGANFVNTIINSTSATPLSAGAPPYTGAFQPDAAGATYTAVGFTFPGGPTTPAGYIPTVSTFNGLYSTPNGTWSLGMYDWGAGDLGTLTNWELVINYTTPGGTGSPLTYTWSPAAGLYMDAQTTIPYITGTQTPSVYAAPTAFTIYTVTGTDAITGCSNTATAAVNYTPPAPTITPSAVAMCLGDPAVRLTSASSTTTVTSFTSGPISVPFPDFDVNGASSNITVSGIPAVATVTAVKVTFNLTQTYSGDMVLALKAPNGNILNLDYHLSGTFQGGTGFVNTAIGSTGTAALSTGTGNYTGLFRADAQVGPGAFGPAGPTGFDPTGNSWTQLYSVPNGTWTLAGYDGGPADLGTLTSWTIEVTYMIGVAATPAVWSPITGLFNDAGATIAYAGTPRDTVWARPTPDGVYPYTATVQSVGLPPTTVATPMAGGNGNNLVTFNVRNSNAFPVTFTGISSNAFASGAVVSRVFYKTTAIAGAPGNIDAANGWTQFGTANNTVVANTLNPLMSGLTLTIPANTTYGIALDFTGATFPAYTNGTGTLATYTAGGVSIITDGNVGWGGPAAPGAPVNNPRNFNGTITVSGSSAAPCTSPARTVVVTVNAPTTVVTQPVNQTNCTDKVSSFTVVAGGTGPFTYQWQVSTDNGNTWNLVNNGGVYSGANTATLTITAPPVSMSGYLYRVVINGAAPCASITSAQRLLTVNPLPVVVISGGPTRLLPGMTASLTSTVTPNAAGPGGYVWLRDGIQVVGAGTGSLNVTIDNLGDYSLRVTDVNGCTSTSNIISIRDSVSTKCFIYPNPNSGQFQVRYYSTMGNTGLPRTLTVFDGKGDRVMSQNYVIGRPYDRMDVDMRKYGKGIYWVEISDANGNRLSMCRVVIQ